MATIKHLTSQDCGNTQHSPSHSPLLLMILVSNTNTKKCTSPQCCIETTLQHSNRLDWATLLGHHFNQGLCQLHSFVDHARLCQNCPGEINTCNQPNLKTPQTNTMSPSTDVKHNRLIPSTLFHNCSKSN